jgi:hypothetical protein
VSTQNDTKLKTLLALHRPGTALLASWLEGQGISRDLQKSYRRSGWLETLGTGAFKRPNETVTWQGGLYAVQTQGELPIHAGALTALSLQGFSHYLRLGGQTVFLFSPRGTKLPAWFKTHDWGVPVRQVSTTMLPPELGLTDYDERNFKIRISAPERAMLECLHLAPRDVDLVECFQVMEGLGTLRPKLVQELLFACTSVKAKRLFLYMAERANHQWLSMVDLTSVDLGKGDRSLATGGAYVPKYHLVIPNELAPL